jgi:DNA polymerase-3 subunit epsilon
MQIARQGSFDDLGTPLSQVTFVVLDVETTGGSPADSSLTEVAAARYRGGELLGTYQTFVRPDERIPPFITALTGISDAMVADAPRVGQMLPSLVEFVGGAVLVGHNVRFDLSFIDHALLSTGRERLANATVDTLALARRLVRDLVPNCKLGTLACNLRLPHQPSHRALTDVLATADLLHAMLERAGSFGILGLEELLDLPRLVGHPHAAKLRLTTRLPHATGVFWFTDAAGHVLFVGMATDLRKGVRSLFSGERRPRVTRLLHQLDAVHHRVCPGTLTAEVLEGRLLSAWSPPFNRPGKRRRAGTRRADRQGNQQRVSGAAKGSAEPRPKGPSAYGRGHRRRRASSGEEHDGDPMALLAPLCRRLAELSRQQRFEEAASVRDEAEGLRHVLARHRQAESLRRAGLVVLAIDGEGTVALDGGLLVEGGETSGSELAPDSGWAAPGDDGHGERAIVAQWLMAHAGQVRILEVESPLGMALPAHRIPQLEEVLRSQVEDSGDPGLSNAERDGRSGRGGSDRAPSAA